GHRHLVVARIGLTPRLLRRPDLPHAQLRPGHRDSESLVDRPLHLHLRPCLETGDRADERVAFSVLGNELPDPALQVPALDAPAHLHRSLSGTTTARPAHQATNEPSKSPNGTTHARRMGR